MTAQVLVGTDDAHPVVDALVAAFERRGCVVRREAPGVWGPVARVVAGAVASGDATFGVVCCWTGTGVSIVANKVPGVRAALCVDAATATGARRWNDANVLAISLRLTSAAVADEIVEAWLGAAYDGTEAASLACVHELDARG